MNLMKKCMWISLLTALFCNALFAGEWEKDYDVAERSDLAHEQGESGVWTSLIKNEYGTFLKVRVFAEEAALEEEVNVNFGIMDINGEKHSLYEKSYARAELANHKNAEGIIEYEQVIPVDALGQDAMIHALAKADLLEQDAELVNAKSAGSFTASARVWTTFPPPFDDLKIWARGSFSCTGCTIQYGYATASAITKSSQDSCYNCTRQLYAFATDKDSNGFPSGSASVYIQQATWTPSGILVNYYISDSK